jgi:hypothetical protein
MEYLSEIICAVIGFFAGAGVTIAVKNRKDPNKVNQSHINAETVSGRDTTIHK